MRITFDTREETNVKWSNFHNNTPLLLRMYLLSPEEWPLVREAGKKDCWQLTAFYKTYIQVAHLIVGHPKTTRIIKLCPCLAPNTYSTKYQIPIPSKRNSLQMSHHLLYSVLSTYIKCRLVLLNNGFSEKPAVSNYRFNVTAFWKRNIWTRHTSFTSLCYWFSCLQKWLEIKCYFLSTHSYLK